MGSFLKKYNRWGYIILPVLLCCIATGIFLVTRKSSTLEKEKTTGNKTTTYLNDSITIGKTITLATQKLQYDTDTAIQIINKARQINLQYGNNETEVRLLSILAACYIRKSNLAYSQSILDTAFKKLVAVKSPNAIAMLYNASAVLYQQNGQYAKSIFNYFEGIDCLKKAAKGESINAAKMYNNLAGLFILLEQWDQAQKYLNEAKRIINLNNNSDKLVLAYVLCNSGLIHMKENPATAATELNKALALCKEINDPYLSTKILINLANINLAERDFDKAGFMMEQAKAAAIKSKNPIANILINYMQGNALLAQKQANKALPYLSTAYNQSMQAKYNDVLLEITHDLQQAYRSTGNYKEAYTALQQYDHLKEEKQVTEKKRTLDLVIQYQTAEKDRQLAQSQLEISRQQNRINIKNIWIGIFIAGTVLLIVLFVLVIIYNRNRQRLQLEELKTTRQQHDIAHLTAAFNGEERERARISHDIHDGVMSTFAIVKMKIKKLEKEVAGLGPHPGYQDALYLFDKATDELRMTAHNLMPDLLLDSGLQKALYYFVQGIKENTGIDITYETTGQLPELSQDFLLFLYRAVQELVQNTIKHANASHIIIQLIYGNEVLNVTVEDNGKPVPGSFREGMGLKSLRNRVKLYGGQINILTRLNTGTSVTLDFLMPINGKPYAHNHYDN